MFLVAKLVGFIAISVVARDAAPVMKPLQADADEGGVVDSG